MRVRKGSLVFLLVFSMIICFLSFPVSAAADDRALLIQQDLPWETNTNTVVLDKLVSDGHLASYEVRNFSDAAPAGLIVTSSAAGGSTGKITGTTPAMEYKLSTASTYKAVTGTEITGLAAGIYDVRYAAKEGCNAGAAATVIVSDVLAASIATPTPAVLSAAAPAVIAATGEHDNNVIMGLLLILAAGSTVSIIVRRARKSDV